MKKANKTQQIRNLLAHGKSVASIATKLKVKPNYVYSVRWHMKKKPAKPNRLAATAALKRTTAPAETSITELREVLGRMLNMVLEAAWNMKKIELASKKRVS